MLKKKIVQGLVKRHPDGFGFLVPDEKDHPDVYIPRHSMGGVMTNDKVMAQVEPERGGERFRGEVIRIVSRGTTQVVGQFTKFNEKYGVVRDESLSWGQDLKIKWEDSMGAEVGQLVAADILKYPDDGEMFLGKVKHIIGFAAEPMNDIKRVVMAQQIPSEFPAEVEVEAKKFPVQPNPADFAHRRDLRQKKLITIDGKTAKDFDDAVLVETDPAGFRLFVAIADVSHYVQINSAIDKEAYIRGTSVYFPNFVIPMLPEALSNGLCSLMPHVPRLCLVSEMKFDFEGEMKSSEFYEAVMESHARVTYGEAQEVVDGSPVEKLDDVKDNILKCADLAKILMARRFREGSLDLEIPETMLEIDASGVPVDVIRSERLFAHRLIEELMLAANVSVAKYLTGRKVPALYRIHEPPHEAALMQLEKYMQNFGSRTDLGSGKLQKRLTKALQEFSGKPEAQVLNILTLRSMNQAKYNMNNVGHFGLGFQDYTHFTSPIRRYPDLIVHRLLKNQIMPDSQYRLMTEDDLQTAGVHLSACEQRSAKAERQLMAIKKARFMEKHVGEKFEGLISSVVRFGVFVLLREFDIDGLIRLDELAKEKLEFDEENLKLISKRSGLTYGVGDLLEIVVNSVDIDLGQINFSLASWIASGASQISKDGPSSPRDRRDEKRADKHNSARRGGAGGGGKANNKKKFSGGMLFKASPDKLKFPSRSAKKKKTDSGASSDTYERPSFALKNKDKSKNQKKEKAFGSRSADESVGKNPEKRSETANNSRGVRKARISRTRKKN